MSRLIAAAAILTLSHAVSWAYDPAKWERSTEFFTLKGNTFMRGTVFGNTFANVYIPQGCAPGRWCLVDISAEVGADAKAAFLAGPLIITGGNVNEMANITVSFREPGNTEACPVPQIPACVPYIGQTINTLAGSGQRSSFASWVPLKSGQFEVFWTVSTSGVYPATAAYGMNLTLQAWTR